MPKRKPTLESLPAEVVAGILTPEEFAALPEAGAPFTSRKNHALHLGGSVDICANASEAVAVVRYVKITDKVRAEVSPLLTAARETIATAAPAPSP